MIMVKPHHPEPTCIYDELYRRQKYITLNLCIFESIILFSKTMQTRVFIRESSVSAGVPRHRVLGIKQC